MDGLPPRRKQDAPQAEILGQYTCPPFPWGYGGAVSAEVVYIGMGTTTTPSLYR